jgi:elongator complex protein 4
MLIVLADPALSASFPSYHGFVHIHALPSPLALTPPSDKFSSLRGLSSSGENNLAFKCMRKRLIFETLHLDVEGGVGERRTTPAAVSIESVMPPKHSHGPEDYHTHASSVTGSTGMAVVEVQLERIQESNTTKGNTGQSPTQSMTSSVKKPKPKKKVGFVSDKPDLYDF